MRFGDPADRRGALIQLTEWGVAVAEAAVRASSAAHAAVFAGTPASVVEAATRVLRELSAHTGGRREPPPSARALS
jgi:hypothetical protein